VFIFTRKKHSRNKVLIATVFSGNCKNTLRSPKSLLLLPWNVNEMRKQGIH